MSPPDDGDREPSNADPPGPSTPHSEDDSADTSPSESADATRQSDPDEAAASVAESDRGTPGSDSEGRARPVGLDGEPAEGGNSGTNWRVFVYDVVNSAVAVLLVGALLFAVSGVWPPMVAVESPSMNPQLKTGDLVFVMEETRFPGEGAHGDTGVVTARAGRTTEVDYRKFQRQGDVIVYKPDGNGDTTPIIHRAMFWVEEDENWYDKADRQSVGRYDRCGESPDEAMPNCPAPHAGFVTKGDANSRYDQVDGLSGPVRPAWVVGTAEVRVPLLGCIRLRANQCAIGTTTLVGATGPDATGAVDSVNVTVPPDLTAGTRNATAP